MQNTRKWSFSGGTVDSYTSQYMSLGQTAISPSYGTTINLGGSADGSGFTNTSELTVSLTDPADNANAKYKYRVRWHLPVENTTLLPFPGDPNYEYTNSFITAGALSSPVGAGTDFPDGPYSVSYDPYYIQFVQDYAHNAAEILGENALNWANSTTTKLLLIVAKTIGKNASFTTHTPSISTNHEEYFRNSQTLSAQNRVPLAMGALIPPNKTFAECVLVKPFHYHRFKHEYWQHDIYDQHGFAGQQTTKNDNVIEEEWAGKYEAIDVSGAS